MNNYIKPDIAFQPMALATSTSSGCTMNATQEEYACSVHITEWGEGWTLIVDGSCFLAIEPGKHDQFCYHVPMGDTVVFES